LHYRQVTDSGIAAELLDRHQRPHEETAAVRSRFVSLVMQSLAANPNFDGLAFAPGDDANSKNKGQDSLPRSSCNLSQRG
jgi:hypothetical protein